MSCFIRGDTRFQFVCLPPPGDWIEFCLRPCFQHKGRQRTQYRFALLCFCLLRTHAQGPGPRLVHAVMAFPLIFFVSWEKEKKLN
jgi:hypothetical protein